MAEYAEYIEREALMRRIKEIHCAECNSYHGLKCKACWVDDALDYIESEPAADVAPVRHGRWSRFYKSGVKVDEGFVSSCCDMWNERRSNYCPNCGCRMDGGDD